jgi:hypothetical protein
MTSRHPLLLVSGFVCGLNVLAPSGADAQSGHDACALVTQAQVTSAVGATVGAGQPINNTGCQWSTDPAGTTGHVMITLSIWGEKWFSKKPTPGIPMKPVSGIGDDAYFATLGDLTSLFVKKGKSTLQLRVYGLHDTAKQELIERSVARDALARF